MSVHWDSQIKAKSIMIYLIHILNTWFVYCTVYKIIAQHNFFNQNASLPHLKLHILWERIYQSISIPSQQIIKKVPVKKCTMYKIFPTLANILHRYAPPMHPINWKRFCYSHIFWTYWFSDKYDHGQRDLWTLWLKFFLMYR